MLVLGISVIGCDNDTWSNVTNFSQVNGTWKAQSSYSGSDQDLTINVTTKNYLVTYNSTSKTMSISGSTTTKYSGTNISTSWPVIKQSSEYMNRMDSITASVNDTNHSVTITYNNFSQVIPDEAFNSLGIQINQNGSKIKMGSEGTEIIFTKQLKTPASMRAASQQVFPSHNIW